MLRHAAAALALVLLAPLALGTVSHTESYAYVLPHGVFAIGEDEFVDGTPAIGGAPFTILPGESLARVTIDDEAPMQFAFRDPAFTPLLEGTACGPDTGTLPIPAGATELRVWIGASSSECGSTLASPTGVITGSFWSGTFVPEPRSLEQSFVVGTSALVVGASGFSPSPNLGGAIFSPRSWETSAVITASVVSASGGRVALLVDVRDLDGEVLVSTSGCGSAPLAVALPAGASSLSVWAATDAEAALLGFATNCRATAPPASGTIGVTFS